METAQLAIQFVKVNKWFENIQVLFDINLQVSSGAKIVICGPSGSGKSTLLRCINGLEEFQQGAVLVDGMPLTKEAKKIQLIRSEVGMCFQQFNLFPHLTALQNCTLALRYVRHLPEDVAIATANKFLERVQMLQHENKYPAQLSGGQQQRVAIARSLCLNPKIMLFDEPTSALDPEMIQEVLEVMTNLAAEGMTMVCVTHEMNFARTFADQIIFMDAGRILECAAPQEFFNAPQTERARAFLKQIYTASNAVNAAS